MSDADWPLWLSAQYIYFTVIVFICMDAVLMCIIVWKYYSEMISIQVVCFHVWIEIRNWTSKILCHKDLILLLLLQKEQ